MSDCLHCEINQLVQDRISGGGADLGDLASMVIESLADLILLAPDKEQAQLIAYAISDLGKTWGSRCKLQGLSPTDLELRCLDAGKNDPAPWWTAISTSR